MFNSILSGDDKYLAWKTKNNKPMPQEEAYARIRMYGYEPIDKYVNNRTRMQCYDKDGYIIKLTLDSLGRCKTYQRFSPTCNEENFMYNLKKWGKDHNYPSIPLSYFPSKTPKQTMLRCRCECGEIFDINFCAWHKGTKIRCNKCTSKISNIERAVKDYLDENNIRYIWQHTFDDCKDKRKLPFDFYLPDYDICIEVDGEQHFYSYNGYNQIKCGNFEDRIKKDNIKTKYCKDNEIELIRLRYNIIRSGSFVNILNNELNIR